MVPNGFPRPDTEEYNLVVSHSEDDYCIERLFNVTVSDETYVIVLEKGIGCKSKLHAQVIDLDGEPVVNATVAVYDEEGFSLGLPSQITDLEGNVELSVVSSEGGSGTYKVFAYKGTISGWSDAQYFSQELAEELLYTVQ